MRVEIRNGVDGVECWNREAVHAYVAAVNEKEARLSRDNPDLVVTPGEVKCYGCVVQEYDYGIRCSAELTRTRFTVAGEVEPRAADAAAPLREIAGLESIKPGSEGLDPTDAAPLASWVVKSKPAPPSGRSGRRGLFGRS